MSSATQAAPPYVTTREHNGDVHTPRWPGGYPEAIHGIVVPADVRAGDPVFASVRWPGRGRRSIAAQVWRISPLGVELVRPPELGLVRAGAALDLLLRVGQSAATFRSLPVVTTGADLGRELLGLRWVSASGAAASAPRRATRWACAAEYLPTGIAPSAARFCDYVFFRIADVSWAGMQLETSLRNKFIIPGLSLDGTCTFPTHGQVHLTLRVVHVRVVRRGEKHVLSVGVQYASRSARATETIGQYLLQFGSGATVAELCASGFRLSASSRALDFGSVRSAEEYAEVLRLRRVAYVHARKLSDHTKDVEMADGFDRRSRIVVARHHGRVVATSRLTFPEPGADRLNHEEFLELPASLPPRGELVEVFKTCTHPAYRGSDLFYMLLKHVGLTILQAGRRYALMSATDGLARVYERFGFRRLGASYQHPRMRIRHHLMLLDVASVVAARRIGPVAWNLVAGRELWAFARLCGAVPGDRWSVARVRLFTLFRPIAALLRAHYARRVGSTAGAALADPQAPALRMASTTASSSSRGANAGKSGGRTP
jgi:predicted GNAT family N-acyltransferase